MNVPPSQTLLGEPLPRIEVTDRVMAAIRTKQGIGGRSGRSKRSRLWYTAVIAAAVVFACGFGYAASSWQLFAPNGSVALEYRNYLPGDEPIRGIDTDALRDKLAEGEAAVFYIREQDQYIGLVNERRYSNYDDFAQAAGGRAPARELGGGWEYRTGSLVHELQPDWVVQRDKTDFTTDGDVSYRKIPLGPKNGYHATYGDNTGQQMSISATFNERMRTLYTDLAKKQMEKVHLNGIEAFYIREAEGDVHRMVWAEGEGNSFVYYSLSVSSSDERSQDWLREVALELAGKSMSE